jgi:hypothetical protein
VEHANLEVLIMAGETPLQIVENKEEGQGRERFVPRGQEGLPFMTSKAPDESKETPSELPEKYRGKSVEDIVKMHQEAERLITKQGQDNSRLAAEFQRVKQMLEDTPPPDIGDPDEEEEDEDDPDDLQERRRGKENRRGGRGRTHQRATARDVEKFIDTRARRVFQEAAAEHQVETAWAALQREKGLTNEDINTVKGFWSNPANLTPEFLYSAMNLKQQIDAERRKVAEQYGRAFQRASDGSATIIGGGGSAGDAGTLQAQLREAWARGDKAGADKIAQRLFQRAAQ